MTAVGDDGNLGDLIDELFEGWRRFVNAESPLQSWRGRSQPQVAMIMALTAHVHLTSNALRQFLPDTLTIAQMPLVRVIYESTITAVWLDEVPDAAQAMLNEATRGRKALRDTLATTATMTEMAARITHAEPANLPTTSDSQARHVQRRCEDIGADGAYAIYRVLCGLSHPSIEVVDSYLDENSLIAGQPMSVLTNPGPLPASRSWAHLVASCMTWCGMVANYLDDTRSRRNDLRRIGRALGINPELPVRYAAVKRAQT